MATQAAKTASRQRVLGGKTAVVTGASRGIGKAIALTFAQAGARIIFVVRDRSAGERAAEELRKQGYEVEVGVADVAVSSEVGTLAQDIRKRYSAIDILVNNAGIFLDEDRKMRPAKMDLTILDRTLRVNLYGPIQVSNAFTPFMNRGGRVINVSSTMGQLTGGADGYGAAYSISKAALNMYTQQLAADLRDRDIMVDSFHPGWVKTQMGGQGASVEPEDAAETALFLASRPLTKETGLFWHRKKIIDW